MDDSEIRTIMAPLINGHILLPNSAVAEVVSFITLEPLDEAPEWLLGELTWNGWQVPVVCYEQLVNDSADHTVTPRARILIVKTLGESPQVNYIGLIIQGLPKLKTVSMDTLVEEVTGDLHETQFGRVKVGELHGVIPEIGQLTRVVEHAAYGR